MRNFQGIVFIWTQTYRENNIICISVSLTKQQLMTNVNKKENKTCHILDSQKSSCGVPQEKQKVWRARRTCQLYPLFWIAQLEIYCLIFYSIYFERFEWDYVVAMWYKLLLIHSKTNSLWGTSCTWRVL